MKSNTPVLKSWFNETYGCGKYGLNLGCSITQVEVGLNPKKKTNKIPKWLFASF